MTDCVLILTTVPVTDQGRAIPRILVEEELAACVSAFPPMASTYRWGGKVTEDREQQLVIKTLRSRVPDLERRVRELHPYEVPEFLVIEISAGSEAYLEWLSACSRSS